MSGPYQRRDLSNCGTGRASARTRTRARARARAAFKQIYLSRYRHLGSYFGDLKLY